ncbi:hypothetical protein L9F63_004751 [Diploptera punctata]|uniref:Uncharacterized protein n=1 Tax=Diploptera punctata TaxID=6984 RepID=A0AAD8E7C4_DIPPU|nr:hypothetical protein L9F63_004751 [Diploptera punctata]
MNSTDLLRCSICKDMFDQTEHKPKFLHCHHSYCVQCLTDIQCKKKTTDGGGVEYICPSCQKITRVGKKGIDALQDNFYILSLNSAIKDNDLYQSDDESVPKSSSMVTAWCNTCFKVAGLDCSRHDICNLEEGRKQLEARMQTVMEQTEEELKQELQILEPSIEQLRLAHNTLEEQMNIRHESLALARSELESLKQLKIHHYKETDLDNKVVILKKTEMVLSNSQKRLKWINKEVNNYTSLDKCHIVISTNKMSELSLDITGSSSVEKQVLFWLSQVLHSKQLEDITWEQVNKGNRKSRNTSLNGSRYNSLASTPAVSTESLTSASHQAGINKLVGNCTRCFFDISINSEMKGRFIIEIRPDVAPKMCANFVALCTGDLGYGYKGSKIFKALANDHIAGGDFIKNDGTGGHSIYNNKKLFVGDRSILQDEKGAVRMRGMGTDGMSGGGMVGSQFFIWVGGRAFRTYKRTLVFGYVVEGLELCKTISNLKTHKNSKGAYIIGSNVVIENCGKL